LCFYFKGEIKEKENQTFKGALMKIIDELAKHSNFDPKFIQKRVLKANDLTCLIIEVQALSRIDPHISPFYKNELYFVVPLGQPLSEWEFLLLAFDAATWYLIVATFTTAFAFIFIVKVLKATTVRNFVFGRNVSSPALNILVVFFGLSQVMLPRRNFARFTLTLFIIWSLIIRTCYNGLLFEYLQSDKHHPGVQTIDELMTKNFTYFGNTDLFELIEQESDLFTKVRNSLSKIVKNYLDRDTSNANWTDILNAYLFSPRNESVLIVDTFQIIDFQTLLIMKETIRSFYGGIKMIEDYFSQSIIKKAIANLTENGIINHQLSEMYESKFFDPEPEPKEPEVLTLSQLAVGFKLYGYCLCLSVVLLLVEHLIVKVESVLWFYEAKKFVYLE